MSVYLVIAHAVTAGQDGPLLGSDEEEVVLLIYLVLDVVNNKVSWQLDCRCKVHGLAVVCS